MEDNKNVNGQQNQNGSNDNGQQNNNQQNGSAGTDNSGGQNNQQNNEKTFTQDEVTRMMTTEKKQGRNSVYRQLGLDPNTASEEDVANAFKEFTEYQNSKKSEAEKAAAKALEDQKKLEAAQQQLFLANAKVKAMQLGVQPQFVDDVVTLASTKLGADEKSDLDALAKAVGELKAKYPTWFGQSDEGDDKAKNKNNAGMRGTGSSVSGSSQKKEGESSMGARLAAQRKQTNKKSSFWN